MEAEAFVTDVLGLSDVNRKLAENKFSLLCEIVKASQESIPFQSVTLLSSPLHERHKPTFDEMMREMHSSRGGLCYTLNTFMKLLLEALGYSVYHIVGSVLQPENHIITIAIFNGTKYLIEIGCGYPTFQPIPLNFTDESLVYEESFIKYKFKWVSEDTIERQHLFLTPGAQWQRFYSFNVTPQQLKDLDKPMTLAYTDINAIPFHTSFRAIKFYQGKATVIRDRTLLVEDNTHVLQETKLLSEEEVLQAVKDNFPQLEEVAKSALKNC